MTSMVKLEVNNSTPSKWDQDSQNMRESREWLVQQASDRITNMCNQHLKKYLETNPEVKEVEEVEFEWVNVKTDLMTHCKVLVDGKYNKDATPMKYSFDTIFNGGFGTSNGYIDRKRMRRAGVSNPFVLDVKRAIASKCVKVWDISDKDKSNKIVWKITIFVHELRKLNQDPKEV